MFKKLKEKVIDSQTSQRFQQITQSVSDKFQNLEKDDNFFSLTEDDNALNSSTSTSLEPGFSNISLTSTPQENINRQRKTSTSSMTSEASFLPRYDSVTSIYHLQSDLDVSASEMEDNISTASSQIGHLSKEQIYSAFQKSQMRYHKYRGRFTDLTNHYKNLEREFNKLKTELEKNQERSFRRVKELKEQCELEQKAKAHLESSLRVDLDEKEYQIGTLKEKINILQNNPNMNVDIEQLTKNLNDTKQENENLNTMNQEIKAKLIILQSKEDEYKEKIKKSLEEMVKLKEEEKENNLKLAESKMMIHNEMLSKERELSDLRLENENLKKNLEIESKNNASTKLEQLQNQNKNLIEKVEVLSQKCQGLNNEVLKLEQYKLEIQNLKTKISEEKSAHDIEIIRLTEENKELKEKFFKERQEQVNIIDNLETMLFKNKETYESEIDNLKKKIEDSSSELELQKKNYEEQIEKLREEAKQGIISLQEKMRVKFEEEFKIKEIAIKEELEELSTLGVEALQNKIVTLEKERNNIMHKMDALKEEFEKLSEYSNNDKKIIEDFNKNLKMNQQIVEEYKEKEKDLQENCAVLMSEKKNLENLIQSLREELTKNKIESETKNATLSEHEDLLLEYDRMKEEYENLIKQNEEKPKLTDNSYTENQLYENKEELIKLEQEKEILGISCSDLQEKIKILEMELERGECSKQECKILELKLKESLKENEHLEEKSNEMEKRLNEIGEYLQQKEGEFNEVKSLFENLKASSSEEIRKLNDLVESLTQTEANTKKKLADKERNLENLIKEVEVKIQYIKNLEENYKLLDKNEKDLKKEIEKYKSETDSKSKAFEKIENDYKEIQKLYSTEKKDIMKQLNILKQVEKNYYSLLDENENLKEQISEIAILQEKLKSLSEVEKEKIDLKENINEMEKKIAMIESLNKEYETKLEYLKESREEINKLETEKNQLFEEVAVLKEIKEEKNAAQKELNDIKNILQVVENKYGTVQLEFNNFKDIADSEKKELLNKYEQLDEKYKELSNGKNEELQKIQNDYQRIQQNYDILENSIRSEKEELNLKFISIENKYKEVCLQNNDFLQKISQLEQEKLELTQKLHKIMQETDKNDKMREDMIIEKEELKSKLFKIEISKEELNSLLELNSKENNEMMEEISKLKGTINTVNKEKQNLQESYAKVNDLDGKYKQLQIEFTESNNILNKLKAENEILNQNNKQISSDYKNILEENNKLIAELEEFKLNLENYSVVKVQLEEDKIKINIEKKELLSRLEKITEENDQLKKENYDLRENKINKENNEVELLDVQQSYYKMKTKHDELCLENRELNKKIEKLTKNIESFKEEKRKYENSIRELERHQNELMNEKLLLKEEIEELKTSPLNLTSAKASSCEKINNFNILKHNNILDNHESKEMEQMEEKLTQLKSLDITNKATIEFYENEVQKLKTNNEKLNRRLDETLVTLNHCSELSQSTELEYLKNVLYNYMLGKEGVVLAKVIATVCKFDHEQTEEVLKKEHQKQTLLAKLGLL